MPHLHLYILVKVLSHVLIFYFIIWLLEGLLESHQSLLTISPKFNNTDRKTSRHYPSWLQITYKGSFRIEAELEAKIMLENFIYDREKLSVCCICGCPQGLENTPLPKTIHVHLENCQNCVTLQPLISSFFVFIFYYTL